VKEETLQKLQNLQSRIEKHIQVNKALLKANPQRLFAIDMLAMSAIYRSYLLIPGFSQMIQQENLICAAPLIRLQIDNCLRFFASSLVQNADDFSKAVLRGDKVSNIKDRDGKKMTDAHLVKQFSVHYPWFRKVYEETSGYVHLSRKHFYNAIKTSHEDGTFTNQLLRTPKDSFVPDETYDEAVEAFTEITDVFLELMQSWTDQKAAEWEDKQ
jgi:hypothetical protein